MQIDTQIIIPTIAGIVSTGASGWISHLLTKRKYKMEVEQMKISNDKDKFQGYVLLLNDLTKRVEGLTNDLATMREKYEQIYIQNNELTRQNQELASQNKELVLQNERLVQDNAELKTILSDVLNKTEYKIPTKKRK